MSYVGQGDWNIRANADSLAECASLLAEQRAKHRRIAVSAPFIVRRFTESGTSWALYETQGDADADAATATGNPARAYGFVRCIGALTPGTITPAEVAELLGFLAGLVRDSVSAGPQARARLVRAFNALVSTSEI